MSKNLKVIFFILIFGLFSAQVGINTQEPNSNSALHISEKMKASDPSANNILKGILIPRLTEQERDRITYSDPPVNSILRLTSEDNSLMIFNVTENCYNYWNTQDSEWKSLCGNIGNAKFTFSCGNNVEVKGIYVKDKELDNSQSINIINVNVTKTGNYLITATSANNNGYTFAAQGIFTTTGNQTVRLVGQGKPINAQVDNFTLTASDPASTCSGVSVIVQPDIAGYSLNCGTSSVNGTYIKGTALTSSNTISLNVVVNSVGSYYISTPVINGISFSKTGTFTNTGNQSVVLTGTGIPTTNIDFKMSVNGNSAAENAVCEVTIPVTLPAMTYAVIGENNVYTWHPNNVRAQAFNGSSFGPSGKVRIVSLTNLWNTSNTTTAIDNLNNTTKPDILLFFSYGTVLTSQLSASLSDYVNNGGVLIFGSRDNQSDEANLLLTGIFGEANAQQQIAGSGSVDDNVYPININENDPLINGPFGNASGKYWGEDNSSTGTIILTQLPANSIQIAGAANQFSKYEVNPSYSTVWYNNSKNFVYFGDSTGASSSSTSLTSFPSLYLPNGLPQSKRYGQFPNQSTQSQFVYNSILELNAVAWGLRKAASVGINPH